MRITKHDLQDLFDELKKEQMLELQRLKLSTDSKHQASQTIESLRPIWSLIVEHEIQNHCRDVFEGSSEMLKKHR